MMPKGILNRLHELKAVLDRSTGAIHRLDHRRTAAERVCNGKQFPRSLFTIRGGILIFLRKFLGLILTTLLFGILLTLIFVITEGSSFLAIGLFITGVFPFLLLVGVPVSFLSDCLTKNLNGKLRNIVALLIHSIFGVIAGLVISKLLESLIHVGMSITAALIFWLVDEILRKKI